MAPDASTKSTQTSREELDTIANRVAIAFAKREKLIKSWTASSARSREPEKTQEELDAEDAALFKNEPPYLGVGAPIPSHFLISDAERNKKTLRAKFFPMKGLKASKQRDAEEKAASAKRGLKEDSSDDEGGRSTLGKAKKQKIAAPSKVGKEVEKKVKVDSEDKDIVGNIGKARTTPTINPSTHTAASVDEKAKENKEDGDLGSFINPSEGSVEAEPSSTSTEEANREKLRLKRKMKKLRKKNKDKLHGASVASTGLSSTP